MANILIVDDAAFMRMVIKTMVEKYGHVVVGEAENGNRAILKYREVSPDIVTMDMTMPELDGISAVKEIMKINPKAKIIMCSAMGQQSMVLESIKAGAKDFLVKPFQEDAVIRSINKQLGK